MRAGHPESANRTRFHQRSVGSDGRVYFKGHDLIGVLTVTDSADESDGILKIPLNPIKLGFEALQLETQLHQQYRFTKFQIHLPPTASTFVNGDCVGWFDRDPNEAAPGGLEGLQRAWYKGAQTCTFRKGHTWSMPRYDSLPALYCQDNGSDERFVDQATFTIEVMNPPSTYTGSSPGKVELSVELWCSYEVEFLVRNLAIDTVNEPQFMMVHADGTDNNYNDIFGFQGVITNDTPVIPGDMTIPGMFFGTTSGLGESKDKLDTKSVTRASIMGMLAGYGMDMGSAYMMHAAVQGDFTQGFNIDISNTVNCDVVVHDSDVYIAATSIMAPTHYITVTEPGLISTLMLDEGAWTIGDDGALMKLPPGEYDVIWSSTTAWNQDQTQYPTVSDSMVSVALLAVQRGPPLMSWAGSGTVEGTLWQRWKKLPADDRRRMKFPEFLAEYRKRKNPDNKREEEAIIDGIVQDIEDVPAGFLRADKLLDFSKVISPPKALVETKSDAPQAKKLTALTVPSPASEPPQERSLASRKAALLLEAAKLGFTVGDSDFQLVHGPATALLPATPAVRS
jgi:hypothetical protein